MPDATGLELVAQELRDADAEAVLGTLYFRDRATIVANPDSLHQTLATLKGKGYGFLSSLHGVDHYPEEPRLGVVYELLDMTRVDRLTVKARVPLAQPELPSVCDLWPGANFPEREVYDMFGVIFEGHPDLRRILLPEDYEGFPQRRDFPLGGEPILFTYNEEKGPRWYE